MAELWLSGDRDLHAGEATNGFRNRTCSAAKPSSGSPSEALAWSLGDLQVPKPHGSFLISTAPNPSTLRLHGADGAFRIKARERQNADQQPKVRTLRQAHLGNRKAAGKGISIFDAVAEARACRPAIGKEKQSWI